MELYLLQHGLALPAEEDPEKPLSKAGVAQVQAAGRALRRLGVDLGLIACSPKKRSRQSAALIAEAVNFPYSDILESELLLPLAPPEETLSLLRSHGESGAVLVAGHLPSLAEVASLALGDGCRVRIHFENGGLCRLDLPQEPTTKAELRYNLTAAQIKLIAG
jgi:phosphohistidine phosphatase